MLRSDRIIKGSLMYRTGITSLLLWHLGLAAIELLSVVYIIAGLGLSVGTALLYVAVQLVIELMVNQFVPSLAARYGTMALLYASVPLRLLAFGCLQYAADDISIIFICAAVAALGAGLSDATRSAYVARIVGSQDRGKKLGIVEIITFTGTSAGAFLSAVIYAKFGFTALLVCVAGCLAASMVLLSLSVALAQSDSTEKPANPSNANVAEETGVVPLWLSLAWWMTGWRYLIEGILYPIYALLTYGSVVKVGLLAAVGPVSGYLAGLFLDKGMRPQRGFAIALIAFGLVGIARVSDPSFAIAVFLACTAAVLGKILGVFEKGASFALSQNGQRLDVVVRRERHSVFARLPLITIGFLWPGNPGSVLMLAFTAAIIAALFILIMLAIETTDQARPGFTDD